MEELLTLLFFNPLIVMYFFLGYYLSHHCFPAGSSWYICRVHKKGCPSAISSECCIVGLDHIGFPQGNIDPY